MTPSDSAAPALEQHAQERTARVSTRPFYWSVRRELWENRSVVLAPVLVAVLWMLGFAISTTHLAERRRALLVESVERQKAAIEQPYDVAAMAFLATALMVGFFYCLDALHGERRDRSILFWKSLPVSDLTAVLAKATIATVVLPAISSLATIATHLVMWTLGAIALREGGVEMPEGATVSLVRMESSLIYAHAVFALWYAPIFGWLLLLSAWARRATFLWAILPPLAASVLEKSAFDSSHLASLFAHRLFGHVKLAFAFDPEFRNGGDMTPGNFFGHAGLWLGLVFTAACLAGAVRLRRQGGPI